MSPRDFVTVWHSFFRDLKDDAKIVFIGTSARSIGHACVEEARRLVRNGQLSPAFTGMLPNEMAETAPIKLERPIEMSLYAGYCKHCNVLWVGEENAECLLRLKEKQKQLSNRSTST